MKSAQEVIHWLEMGAGARWIRRAAVVAGTLALSLLIVWKQFHGPASESTLEQAVVGRQLARGEGFSTLVNHPQTVALLTRQGQRFDPQRPFPELHQAPLYSVVIAGGLRLLPEARRNALFELRGQTSDAYGGDAFLLGANLVLFWAAAWLTYVLGRELFDARVGWVSAIALLVSLSFWQQALALNGTPLLMVLGLATFLVWHGLERYLNAEDSGNRRVSGAGNWRVHGRLALLGLLTGLLFLTEYAAGVLILVVGAFAIWRFRGAERWIALGAAVVGFAALAGPWAARNVALTGHPVALAAHNVALKAGDPTAAPATIRATLSPEGPPISLRKLGNKALTSLQENVKSRFWAGGAFWLAAFFVAGWLYTFRSPVTNRLRWTFTAALAVALLAQATLNSGESERLVAVWLAPLVIVFGVGFFFVLLGSNSVLGAWPRTMAAILIVAQALPLVHDVLAPPPGVRFSYPPYFPALLRGLRTELESRQAQERFGLMADVPAGVAWYGDTRVWTQPARLRDFYAITLEQQIGELLLTPRTLDRPFFTELNANAPVPGALTTVSNRFGDWGEVYGGFVTGTMPREFPLKALHRVAENLYVLLNPALPPVRGK